MASRGLGGWGSDGDSDDDDDDDPLNMSWSHVDREPAPAANAQRRRESTGSFLGSDCYRCVSDGRNISGSVVVMSCRADFFVCLAMEVLLPLSHFGREAGAASYALVTDFAAIPPSLFPLRL